MKDEPLCPACAACREPSGTCFPGPCKIYLARKARPPRAVLMAPCPFCGGDGKVIPDPGNKYRSNVLYRPQCDRCGGGLGGFDTSDFAVAAWNNRMPPQAFVTPALRARGVGRMADEPELNR